MSHLRGEAPAGPHRVGVSASPQYRRQQQIYNETPSISFIVDMESVETFLNAIGPGTWDAHLLANSRCTLATKESVLFELTVVPEICNGLGTMHGGAIATAIDLFTSAALCPHRRGI